MGIGAAEQQAHRQTTGARTHRGETPATGGAADAIPVAVANSRLTAILGLTLLILFALQVVTVLLGVRSVLPWHVVLGLILLPPVLLKLTSVTWRMVSYHRGRDGFRDLTPPPPVLRVLGPLLAGLTVALLVSGITLLDGCPGGRSHRPCSSTRSASTPGWPRPSCTSCRTSCRPCTWPGGTGFVGSAARGARRAAGRRGTVVAASLAAGALLPALLPGGASDYLQHVPLQ